VFKKKGLTGKEVSVDLAFPALHGTFGEDGSLQGMFEMYGVPYVGCNVPASALSMDKALTKIVMSNALIPITKFIHFSKYDWQNQNVKIKNQIAEQLKYPLFVKPVHLGSSIGIGKVKDEKDLEKKIEVALYYDNKVLVEEGVEDVLDITCCVIGNNELTASVLQESVFAQDMFSFEDKYLKDGGAQIGKAQNSLVIPARLSPEITKDIQETAKAVYKALGCSGIARVDFLVERSTNKFYANEVNPLPGTLYHHLWKASGLELPELLTKLIGFAKEKQEEKLQTNYSFESSVLKNLGGGKVKGGKFPL
jgi:D-alanine-D-alanine ligase